MRTVAADVREWFEWMTALTELRKLGMTINMKIFDERGRVHGVDRDCVVCIESWMRLCSCDHSTWRGR
jgi:hypothetical protein